jgi:hypothetical protein
MSSAWIYLYSRTYWAISRLLHRFNLHYMPPVYPEGDTVLWCRWCGARYRVPQTGRDEEAPDGE